MNKRVPKLPTRRQDGSLKWPHCAVCVYEWELEHDPRGPFLVLPDVCDTLPQGHNPKLGPYSAPVPPRVSPK